MAKFVTHERVCIPVGFDNGNRDLKILKDFEYLYEEHAIAKVTSDRNRYIKDGKADKGYCEIEGQVYALGSTARRHQRTRRNGAERYTRDYYRVQLAYMLAKLFKGVNADIELFATHAPQDAGFIDRIADCARDVMEVTTEYGKSRYSVHRLHTLDEPLGGAFATFLDDDGKYRPYWTTRENIVLVIDVGGFTIDVAPIDNGIVDVDSMQSVEFGADAIYRDFIRQVREDGSIRNHFAGISETTYNPNMVQKAIVSGFWKHGLRGQVDVRHITEILLNQLMSEIEDKITQMGGFGSYTDMVTTGGGCGLVYSEFVSRHIDKVQFHLAESNDALLRYANLIGFRLNSISDGIWHVKQRV